MAGRISNDDRDTLATAFRERICETLEVAPFLHQRAVWAASDGLILDGWGALDGPTIRLEDGTVVRAAVTPRPHGRARFLADLGAFKIGKSYGAALWAAGFAAVPGARVSLVGLEYNICEPEFGYICEALLSDRGMRIRAKKLNNSPRQGDMYLELPNGAVFECRSWERKESLKGKENDCYIYCEAYQLPGIECFTSFSQNLRARRGYAYFATTPDEPWVKLLHELGHGADPEWHCTCDVPSEANPFTFDAKAKARDKTLMTKEKYAIHYQGRMSDFVGRVFNCPRGSHLFTASTHSMLFPDGITDRSSMRIPPNWEIVAGADTGTYYSAIIIAFSPDGDAFIIDEFPNYRYIAGAIERDESISIPAWARRVEAALIALRARTVLWADPNSQFKGELRNYGLTLLPANVPVETRTEITREYIEHHRLWIAPWLSVVPYEIEYAAWPEEATLAGKFARIKRHDHSLDPVEHILARRPIGRSEKTAGEARTWAETAGFRAKRTGNIHLGAQI